MRPVRLSYLPFAAAVLLVAGGGLLDSLNHRPLPPGAVPFDPDEALRMTRAIVGDGRPRVPGEPSHARARDAILENLRSIPGLEVSERPFTRPGWKYEYANVIAALDQPGSVGTIVVGAHYDSRESSPGAVDNASGVGILIELARGMAGRRWAHRIVFAFWDGEEHGLVGSKEHVAGFAPEERAKILAAISLDMPGWEAGRLVVHTFRRAWRIDAPRFPPGWLVEVLQEGAADVRESIAIGDPLLPIHYQVAVRGMRVPFASDDGRFLEAGVPAVFLANSSFTRFYPRYHRPGDTIDQVSAGALGACGRTVYAAVARMDRSPPADRFPPGSQDYLVVFGRMLDRRELRAFALLALLPLAAWLPGRWRQAGTLVSTAALSVFAVGLFTAMFPARLDLFVIVLPLSLTLPLLPRRSAWGIRGIALLGLLPGMSLFVFLGVVRATYGQRAPILISPALWAAMAVGPVAYLTCAIVEDRRARRIPPA